MFTASAGVQFVGSQFDDDLNTRRGDCPTLPLSTSSAHARWAETSSSSRSPELFNAEYFVGTLPTTVGTPRLIHR
jgi:hypothetical protein